MQWYPSDEKCYCEHCEEECDEDELTEIDGEMVCEICAMDAQECEVCGSLHFEDNLLEQFDGKYVCDSCESDFYRTCIITGKHFFTKEDDYVIEELRHRKVLVFFAKLLYKIKMRYKILRFRLSWKIRLYLRKKRYGGK